ncbi:CDGSH iron-sulfur domain-containing protein 3, mitochondrial-like isoform X2 [Scyliorhinus torazame]|uniref:CDGSH iron-sulfur domain-containing protein 3, mitochondrial-like isoform X2 n=1 Tax=Scyliorhinus torazame TaxID=75743 RepID=UPI003B5A7818
MNGLLSVIVAQRAVSVQMRSQWYCSPATGGKTAVIAARHPFEAELEAAKRYAWCACGYSKKQPFCDGTHKTVPSAPEPLRFKLEEAKKERGDTPGHQQQQNCAQPQSVTSWSILQLVPTPVR